VSKPSPTLPELAALPELRRHGERAKLLWVNYLNELGLQQRAAHERARAIHMYHVLPAMFGDCYPASEAVVDAVALAGLAYSTQLIIEDRQADGDDAPWPDLLKEGAVLRADLPALLGRTPSHRTGTKAVAVLQQEYQHAVECEQAWSKEQAQITWDAYLRVGADKAALLKAPVFFLADSCGKPVNEGLLRGLDAFSAALQIRDDLTDWRDDWGAGRRAHLELWIGSPIVSAEGIAGVRSRLAQDAVTETAGEDLFVELSKIAPSSAGFVHASAAAEDLELVGRGERATGPGRCLTHIGREGPRRGVVCHVLSARQRGASAFQARLLDAGHGASRRSSGHLGAAAVHHGPGVSAASRALRPRPTSHPPPARRGLDQPRRRSDRDRPYSLVNYSLERCIVIDRFRRPARAERHRRRIADQRETSGRKRLEAQTDQHGDHRVAHHVEHPRMHGDGEHEQRVQHDPSDREEAVQRTVRHGRQQRRRKQGAPREVGLRP
jgi:hypothetical protein